MSMNGFNVLSATATAGDAARGPSVNATLFATRPRAERSDPASRPVYSARAADIGDAGGLGVEQGAQRAIPAPRSTVMRGRDVTAGGTQARLAGGGTFCLVERVKKVASRARVHASASTPEPVDSTAASSDSREYFCGFFLPISWAAATAITSINPTSLSTTSPRFALLPATRVKNASVSGATEMPKVTRFSLLPLDGRPGPGLSGSAFGMGGVQYRGARRTPSSWSNNPAIVFPGCATRSAGEKALPRRARRNPGTGGAVHD